MTIELNRDTAVSLWRHLEKQIMSTDDHERLQEAATEIHAALLMPEADTPKRGRPRGSKNKPPEPLFPAGSTYDPRYESEFHADGDVK